MKLAIRTTMNSARRLAALGLLAAAQLAAAQSPAAPATPALAASGGTILSVEAQYDSGTADLARSIPRFFESYKAPAPRWPVRKYLVTFSSLDFDGSPVTIKAQFFVPLIDGEAELPVYVFASGTTGVGDECAPSLERPETRRWGWYEQNMLAYATLGHIVMFPDYTGFNDPARPQRYFSKLAEGRMMLDAIRATLAFFPRDGLKARPSAAVFTAGYSQGGHAAMAAADLRPEYAPGVPLAGVITYGSTNDVEALVREGPAYAPLIFYSYLSMYGSDRIRPADYLLPKWMPSFEADASTMAVDEFQVHYGFDWKKLYRPEFAASLYAGRLKQDYPGLAAALAENHTGLSGHGVPALVIQGGDDFIVTNPSQGKFVYALRNAGSAVQYEVYDGVSHRYTRMAGFHESLAWMAARVAAIKAGKP